MPTTQSPHAALALLLTLLTSAPALAQQPAGPTPTPANTTPQPADPLEALGRRVQLGVLPTRDDVMRLPEVIALIEGLGLPVIPPEALRHELARRKVDLDGLISYRATSDPQAMARAAEARCALRMPVLILVHPNGDGSHMLLARDPNFLNVHATTLPQDMTAPETRETLRQWLIETFSRQQAATASPQECARVAAARRGHATRYSPVRKSRGGTLGELRVDMMRLGSGRQTIVGDAGEVTRRTGWWALGLGSSVWLRTPRRRHGVGVSARVDGMFAWPATREVTGEVEGGLTLTLHPSFGMVLGVTAGWRGAWTAADAPTPSMRARHPWLGLSITPIRNRYVSLSFSGAGGYWLSGPLITDPHAWWWRAGAEGRFRFRRRDAVAFYARTTFEGVMQRDATRDISMWTVTPGIAIRF